MSERKYSVAEIDDMRRSVDLMLLGSNQWGDRAGDRERRVEERLRTYMLNGSEPEELKAAAAAQVTAWQEAERVRQQSYRQYPVEDHSSRGWFGRWLD